MCIVCVELIKNTITVKEASKAGNEMISIAKNDKEFEHYSDLLEAVDNDDFELLEKVLEEGENYGKIQRTSH